MGAKKAKRDVSSAFLFASPSFLSGVARLRDLFGLFDFYNVRPSPQEADAFALYSDWRVVGQDLRDAVRDLEAELANVQGDLFRRKPLTQATHD